MPKVLLVEDDLDMADNIAIWFKRQNYLIEHVADGGSAIERLLQDSYDLVILDLDLPVKDGLTVCKEYRDSGGSTPILMLTGRAASAQKVAGLDTGADDYLAKPFSLNELLARARALIRRASGIVSNQIALGNLKIDAQTRQVFLSGKEVKLRPREYALLEFFARHPGEVFSNDTLLQRVWSIDSDSSNEAVRSCLRTVRQHLESEPSVVIETVHGVGYRLRVIQQET
ncbi:MAG: response regulator transcription factor [Candidatus Obscuribacterales bacterium]|nr:MAG: response regulator transcription factor [Candidatus Melainabacteria bacterium]